MLVLSNDEISRLLAMEDSIAVLEAMYRDYAEGKALLSPRVDNIAPTSHPGAYYAFKHMGGVWPAQKIQALRINSDVVTHPVIAGKARRVKQPLANGRWVGLVFLFSTETGALLAMFPDGVMQRMRVGAANGIALKHLAREDACVLALIGSGWQAGAQLSAALSTRPIREVRVYSPRKEKREAFVAQARKTHKAKIVAADSAEACVAGADIIAAATSSVVSVIDPAWLNSGVHVSTIKTHEVEAAVLERCDRVLVHDRSSAKQIDNVLKGTPHFGGEERRDAWWNDESGRFSSFPDLRDLMAGRTAGRQRREEITCFVNNVGLGLQFAAAGALVLRKAREAGIGTELPDGWFSEDVHP
jgi:alanine dehydrogenase